ncbi:MAG: phosphoribosyltransferase family protein [Candidatus Bathyarchaeia archaeon]
MFHFARYRNRIEAGQRLAQDLLEYRGKDVVVLAIPRGGVVLGYEVAKVLEAPLDVVVPRKIGAPGNPELAIGAVAEDGTVILDHGLLQMFGISNEYVEHMRVAEMAEVKRRTSLFRGGLPPLSIAGKVVIVVDDGLATGATMKAAVASIRNRGASEVVVAVPVGPPDTVRELSREVDRVVCPLVFEPFMAIGQFYDDFTQVEDNEVIRLLKLAEKWRVRNKPPGMPT